MLHKLFRPGENNEQSDEPEYNDWLAFIFSGTTCFGINFSTSEKFQNPYSKIAILIYNLVRVFNFIHSLFIPITYGQLNY